MAYSLRLLACVLCVSVGFAVSSHAQTGDSTDERVRKLEQDIVMLQRQLARSSQTRTIRSRGGDAAIPPSADLELRLAAIEEAMRDLRGNVEEGNHKVAQLSENFDKFQKDTEFRFSELTPGIASAAAGASQPEPMVKVTQQPQAPEITTIEPRGAEAVAAAAPTETTAGDGILQTPSSFEQPEYSNPRDLYNYAFRLLNQTRYEESAAAFSTFIQKYPQDPLIGNAHYWKGETYYIRRDYVNAADAFRQGFEVLPNGPKAPDNLLKLAMSLDALDRAKEACIVLKQITTKYRKQSVNIAEKAGSEQRRMGCA